jgi:hypothetical protein
VIFSWVTQRSSRSWPNCTCYEMHIPLFLPNLFVCIRNLLRITSWGTGDFRHPTNNKAYLPWIVRFTSDKSSVPNPHYLATQRNSRKWHRDIRCANETANILALKTSAEIANITLKNNETVIQQTFEHSPYLRYLLSQGEGRKEMARSSISDGGDSPPAGPEGLASSSGGISVAAVRLQ